MTTRKIDFRGWNKTTKTMLNLKAITPLAIDPTLKQDGIFIPFDEHVELMQFTGLLDSDKTPIFEGDIITVPGAYPFFDYEGVAGYVGVVEWVYASWQYIFRCVNPDKQGISDGINNNLDEDGDEFKVIGNIYENPELLERQ